MPDIDADGPTSERAVVKFKNWQNHGILIHGQKLQNDIQNFRLVAGFLKGLGGVEGPRLGQMLESMAGQLEKASRGEEPQAD